MARRPRAALPQDAQEAPQTAPNMETVILVKDTFLYGARALAGTAAEVPADIARLLRAKGIARA